MEQEKNLMDNIIKYGMAGATTEVAEFIVSNTYLYLIKKNLIETYGEYDLKTIATQINEHNSKESIKNCYYKQLTENQKQAYNNLLKACNNYESEIYLGNNPNPITYKYTYDSLGNIIEIYKNNVLIKEYT